MERRLSQALSSDNLCNLQDTAATFCKWHGMQSFDYYNVPHLSTEKLLNCYFEQIYIEITTNDTQQTRRELQQRGE